MSLSNLDHGGEDRVPCLGVFQRGVGEHTTIPANVAKTPIRSSRKPVTGGGRDIQFPVRIIRKTMSPRLIV